MGKIKNNQSGFGAIESLLILVIVVMIAGVGWYIYSSLSKTNSAYNSATSTSSSTSPKFAKVTKKTATSTATANNLSLASGSATFMLPAGWTSDSTGSQGCRTMTTSSVPLNCLDSANVLPSSLKSNPNNTFMVWVSVYSLGSNSSDPQAWYENDFQGGSPSTSEPDVTSSKPVNGYKAWYFEQNVTSTANGSEPYQDENYVIISGQKVVSVYSRVKHVNSGSNVNDDFTQYLPAIKSLVNSTKISQ